MEAYVSLPQLAEEARRRCEGKVREMNDRCPERGIPLVGESKVLYRFGTTG